jgi:Uma2 family endonuclease
MDRMTSVAPLTIETIGDLLDRLGGISPQRVRFKPPPGTATEQDVIDVEAHEDRLCELVDGVLVEKPPGFLESLLAGALGCALREFVKPRTLGLVTGASGKMRLFPGLVRIPDVAYVGWDRVPGGRVPRQPIPDLVPHLVVEVLSESNTPAEMARKLGEYFGTGVLLCWFVDPRGRTVTAYTSPADSTLPAETQTLDGGAVLPGFALPLAGLFAEIDEHPAP